MLVVVFYLLITVYSVHTEMKSVTYNVHVLRKSRSNSAPVQSEYVYSHVQEPGDSYHDNKPIPSMHTGEHLGTLDSVMSQPIRTPSVDYEIAKMDSTYSHKFHPSKVKSDAMYERLKSVMHYTPTESEMKDDYYTDRFYTDDDNDIRSNSYYNWPYYSQGAYEQMKLETDMAKLKDKRYIPEKKVIPVYEHQDDSPKFQGPYVTPGYNHEVTTDNIVDKGYVPGGEIHDDDPLVFKGFAWDKGDDVIDRHDSLDHPEKLKGDYSTIYYHPINSHPNSHDYGDYTKADNTYQHNQHNYDKYNTGTNNRNNHKEAYEHGGNNYKGFKDITDTFSKRHGAEDHNRKSKIAMKFNRNKGENRKGFKRVYHKDEYQEDNEFFDNNNHSLSGEDSGASLAHFGGSEAYLKSLGSAAIGNENYGFKKAGNSEHNNYENGERGYSNANSHGDHNYRGGHTYKKR